MALEGEEGEEAFFSLFILLPLLLISIFICKKKGENRQLGLITQQLLHYDY